MSNQWFLSTVCYCPIAYWTWNANGWLYKFGALDFAGGGPVHISSGSAGLAYALVLGKRSRYGDKKVYKPHNVTIVFLGTTLIWFGWFGFNGGSALNASIRAMVAVWNTNLAASTGVIGWSMFHYAFRGRKFTVIGACEGAIAGLVGITPAAGYVTVWYAAAIGFITAIVISLFEHVNEWLRIDDGLEVFKLHGIGGMVGAFLTGIFATADISSLDGIPTIVHGAVDGHGVQIAKQMAEIAAIFAWSFVCSLIMLFVLKYIPGKRPVHTFCPERMLTHSLGMHLRVKDDVEEIGLDMDQFDDETVGEWGFYDTEEGHERRNSTVVMHGMSVPAPGGPGGQHGISHPESDSTDSKEEQLLKGGRRHEDGAA